MHDGRRYTIERAGRHPASLTQAGGATMQAEPALHLLGGLDRDTFKHVFAVGLEELQGLGVLSQEGVRGRLFAAGTGLGSASVPEVMKNLDKELANLLALRGQKQIVNLLVKELKEIEARIRELQGQAAAYAEGQRQQEYLEARVEANRQESEARRRELGRVERLEQARVPWANRNRAREQAMAVEYAQNFPVNGLERLEALHKELDTNRQDRQQRDMENTRLAEQLGRLTPDEAVLAQQEAIEALAGERAHLAAALNDYPGAKSDLDQAQTEFARKLRELGPAWDGPRLAEVDTSVQVRQRVAEFARQLDAAERRHEAARAQERALTEAAAEAQKQAEAAAQQLQDLPAPPLTDPPGTGAAAGGGAAAAGLAAPAGGPGGEAPEPGERPGRGRGPGRGASGPTGGAGHRPVRVAGPPLAADRAGFGRLFSLAPGLPDRRPDSRRRSGAGLAVLLVVPPAKVSGEAAPRRHSSKNWPRWRGTGTTWLRPSPNSPGRSPGQRPKLSGRPRSWTGSRRPTSWSWRRSPGNWSRPRPS